MKKYLLLIMLAVAGSASAHPGHLAEVGLSAGLLHPFIGLDHLLAALATGLIASKTDSSTTYKIPGLFLISMLAGWFCSSLFMVSTWTESLVLLSLIISGSILIFWNGSLVPLICLCLSIFAFLHGHSHGTEIIGNSTAYLIGFIASTMALLAGSVVLAKIFSRHKSYLYKIYGVFMISCGSSLVNIIS